MTEGTGITRFLVGLALFIVLLAETTRIPVDDPATHLELTMIHEVMILDVSGPDLALCEWAHAIKFYGLAALMVLVVAPLGNDPAARLLGLSGGVVGCAVVVGMIESVTARLSLARVPQLLIGASVLAGVALGTALGGR
jgi:formate hydrogenlyase subunit 4